MYSFFNTVNYFNNILQYDAMVCPRGLEPPIYGSGGRRFIQLSHGHILSTIAKPIR